MEEHYFGKVEIQVRFLLGAPIFATLADVVIAAVWRAVEVGSIPTGSTKFKDAFSKLYTFDA